MKKHLNKIRIAAFLLTILSVVYWSHKATQANVNQDKSAYGIDDYVPLETVSITDTEYKEYLELKSLKEKMERQELEQSVYCMTQNAYHEAAGNEPTEGIIAIMNVVNNRLKHRQYPKTICGVVMQKTGNRCEFSWVCDGKQDYQGGNARWQHLEAISYDFLRGMYDDNTNGSLFYLASWCYYAPKGKCSTGFHNGLWRKMDVAQKIGNHIFFGNKQQVVEAK